MDPNCALRMYILPCPSKSGRIDPSTEQSHNSQDEINCSFMDELFAPRVYFGIIITQLLHNIVPCNTLFAATHVSLRRDANFIRRRSTIWVPGLWEVSLQKDEVTSRVVNCRRLQCVIISSWNSDINVE